MSLAVTPSGSLPSTVERMFFALVWISVCVASTCRLGGVGAVRERAERTKRGGVAVTAHDGGAGQSETLLGADKCEYAPDACPASL